MATRQEITGKAFLADLLNGRRDFSNVVIRDFDFDASPTANRIKNYLKEQNFGKYPLILSNATLRNCRATGLELPYVQADGIIMQNCRIENSNFYKGKFYASKLIECEFLFSNFREAEFSYVKQDRANEIIPSFIPNTKIVLSNLVGAKCQRLYGNDRTKILNCDASAINLRYGNLRGFDFSKTKMPFADVYCAILTFAKFVGADFTYKNSKGELKSAIKNLEQTIGIDTADFTYAKMTPELKERINKCIESSLNADFNNLLFNREHLKSKGEEENILDIIDKY